MSRFLVPLILCVWTIPLFAADPSPQSTTGDAQARLDAKAKASPASQPTEIDRLRALVVALERENADLRKQLATAKTPPQAAAAIPKSRPLDERSIEKRLLAGGWGPKDGFLVERLSMAKRIVAWSVANGPLTKPMEEMIDGQSNGHLTVHLPQLGMTRSQLDLFGSYQETSQTQDADGSTVDDGEFATADRSMIREYKVLFVNGVLKSRSAIEHDSP